MTAIIEKCRQFKEFVNNHMLWILLTIGLAEIIAFYMMKHQSLPGDGARLVDGIGMIPKGIGVFAGRVFIHIGPMIIFLLPLAIMGVWSIWKLFSIARISDEHIVRKANEYYGINFYHLFKGQLHGKSFFVADCELCRMLAHFACNRMSVVERLYKKSGLYNQKRWKKNLLNISDGPVLLYGNSVLRVSYSSELSSERHFSLLGIIQELAVTFGFAGTVLALMATMSDMSADLSQAEMINTLISKSAAAFGSTITGIFISVGAYLVVNIFRLHFPAEKSDGQDFEEQLMLDAFRNSLNIKEGVYDKQKFRNGHLGIPSDGVSDHHRRVDDRF